MILSLAFLTDRTPSLSSHLFFHFRIAQTRLMMLHVIHSPKTSTKLASILQGVCPHPGLWGGHRQAHALFASTFFRTRTTYLRFSHHTNFLPKFYVGSTEQSVLDREYNRYRKFLQLRHDRLVLSEVALRYWEQNDNLFHWSPIPINTDPHNFRAFELALIQEWQPPLNFPFINQFYHPRKGLLRRTPLAQTQQFGFRRLWRQARWKTTSSQVRRALHSSTFQSRLQSWTTLHHLGSNTKRRYLTEQHLRSNAGGVIKCYALRRLAFHLQEPHRSLALQSLDRTISFWKGKKAPKAFSFRGLWLLTPNLSKRLRSFLVSWYHSNRHLTIPFHKPSVKVIYTKHPTVGEFLYTHKKAVQSWSTSSTPSCTCDLLRRFPEAVIPGTKHVVLDASKISHSFNPDELATLTGSMNNKFFPSFPQCLNTFIGHVDTWTRRNGLPPVNLSLQQTFFSELWQDHVPHAHSSISHHTLSSIRKYFLECVFHCEDKKASSLRIFCPQLYATCIQNTFMDPKVFSPVPLSPEECVAAYVMDITNKFGSLHPWALGTGRQLPAGYVLPKKKKLYNSGRPIVGFVDAPFRPMLNTLAKLLYSLIPTGCPNHFALGDMYTLLRHLHSVPPDLNFALWNQDLAGFFISIEPPRFLQAWLMLKHFLKNKMDVSDDQYFSVGLNKDNQPGDTIKGKTYRRLNVTRKLRVDQIPTIITTALDMRAFRLGDRVVQQDRGSPMGSPLSPALCLMVVSVEEQIWHNTYQQVLSSTYLWYRCLRYVDNRLILGQQQLDSEPAFSVLLHEHFYQRPIILEFEADQEFLGFQIETCPLEIIYQLPHDPSQILSTSSASPPNVLLSGFRSRCHMVATCAYPHMQKVNGITKLIETYRRHGYDETSLQQIASDILYRSEHEKHKAACTWTWPHANLVFFHFLSPSFINCYWLH